MKISQLNHPFTKEEMEVMRETPPGHLAGMPLGGLSTHLPPSVLSTSCHPPKLWALLRTFASQWFSWGSQSTIMAAPRGWWGRANYCRLMDAEMQGPREGKDPVLSGL